MNKINNLKLFPVTGKEDNAFAGFKINGDQIELYHPEAYQLDLDSPTIREDILSFLRTISIAKTYSNDSACIINSFSKGSEFALLSYLWIITDYLSNGFYTNRETLYQINKGGKVNWRKTLQQQPIVSNANIIYSRLVGEGKQAVDNILVEIHKYCVKKSIELVGWIFNLNPNGIETVPFTIGLQRLYIRILQREIEKTFDDIKKLRLTHMLNIIRGLDESSDEKKYVYGVAGYHYVFERMIDSVFGTEHDLHAYSPGAEWKIFLENYNQVHASKLRPDTILIWEENLYVLDSKYYRFGSTGNPGDLPETTSIHKQITYGEFIKKYNADKKMGIYNAFILPYNKADNPFNLHDDLEYFGNARSHWKDNNEDYHIVHAFLIDLKHLIFTWNRHNHFEDIQNLVNTLQNKKEGLV